MKAIILPFALLLASCGGYQRIGSLSMISTRNMDRSITYVPIQRGVEATARMRNDDALQEAVDQCVNSVPGGEYLMNVAVFVKDNGQRVRVRGDVWGTAVPVVPAGK